MLSLLYCTKLNVEGQTCDENVRWHDIKRHSNALDGVQEFGPHTAVEARIYGPVTLRQLEMLTLSTCYILIGCILHSRFGAKSRLQPKYSTVILHLQHYL